MATNIRTFSTELGLAQVPVGFEGAQLIAIQEIYNAITALAIKVDTFIVPSGGIYLIDNQATPHYWLVTVSNLGVLQTTDTGTNPPT